MRLSLIGWLVIAAVAAVWEALGLAGVDGIWPLTWLIRDAMAHSPLATVAVAGALAWLAYHFLIARRRYGR